MNKKTIIFDVGEDPFLKLNMSESSIHLNLPEDLCVDSTLEVVVYGGCISAEEEVFGVRDDSLKEKGDLYINSKSYLVFDGVKKIELLVRLYESERGENFMESASGGPIDLVFSRSSLREDFSDCNVFEIETAMIWPYGYASLKVWSEGRVKFEFDEDDLITFSSYIEKE